MAQPGLAARVLEPTGELERPFVATLSAAPDKDAAVADRTLEDARERGYREGRERAAAELARELDTFNRHTATALGRLATLEQQLLERTETKLVDLTIEATSRILRQRLEQGDPVAARALREAIESLPTAGKLKARLHPDDLEGARSVLGAEVEAGRLELLADSRVARGGAVVETPVGTIDATIDAAWGALRSALSGEELVK